MLRNMLRRAPSSRLIAGTPFAGILASQIIAETATGDHGPGLLYDEALANPGQRLRVVVTSLPADGDLFVWENGAIEFSGAAPGQYSIGYTPYLFNTALPGDTATINYGSVDATAPGATLTGTATLAQGAAAGESNAAAPGADLTGTATLSPGTATGEQNATAPGATLTGTTDLQAGTATGSGDGAASGATLTGTASITPGTAAGESNAAAPGATLTGTADLQPGTATGGTGNQDAAAAGATLTGTATMLPGVGSGNIPGVALSPADIAAIAAAVWAHPSATGLAVQLAEAWARLGLDPTRPVVQDDASISFGAVLLALAQSGGSVTVTRQ